MPRLQSASKVFHRFVDERQGNLVRSNEITSSYVSKSQRNRCACFATRTRRTGR